MAKREAFLLRTDPVVLEALRRWSDDELRSMNGQLDYLLRAALRRAGRLPKPPARAARPGADKKTVGKKTVGQEDSAD